MIIKDVMDIILMYSIGFSQDMKLLHYLIHYNSSDTIEDFQNYSLNQVNEGVCRHLECLIDHQIATYKHDKGNHRPFTNVTTYDAAKFNNYCLNAKSSTNLSDYGLGSVRTDYVIHLNIPLLTNLPITLSDKFFYASPQNSNEYALNVSVICSLFPNCSILLIEGLMFNHYLCEQFINYLCVETMVGQTKMIVFKCRQDTDWRSWVRIAKMHSQIMKQLGWVITASPLHQHGRVSFIKRIKK